MELKNYQIKYADKLIDTFGTLIPSGQNEVCVFQAPTGSGKTIIAAEFLKLFANYPTDRGFAFIWVSIRRLHTQSKDKLEKYFKDIADKTLTLSDPDDIEDDEIKENQIVFVNWESINKKGNKYNVSDDDSESFSQILQNTRAKRDLFLIIDESHFFLNSNKSQELVDDWSPRLTLQVSATPNPLQNPQAQVIIQDWEVEDEGMIVKSTPESGKIILNKGITAGQIIDQHSSTEEVLNGAIELRKLLKQAYENEGSPVNPLVLIQLPSETDVRITAKIDEVENILKNQTEPITIDNQKLGKWYTSGSKTMRTVDPETVVDDDDFTEFLVFKQALATGWDCPRAAILVAFRDMKSPTFSQQTLGRIVRMPEQKHYPNELLNKAYVFTNIDDLIPKINNIVAQGWITRLLSNRKPDYDSLELESEFLKPSPTKKKLSATFSEIFKKNYDDDGIKDKLNCEAEMVTRQMLAETHMRYLDRKTNRFSRTQTQGAISILGEVETSWHFEQNIKTWTKGFVGSGQLLSDNLYAIIKEKCQEDEFSADAQRIILNSNNLPLFEKLVTKSTQEFEEREYPDGSIIRTRLPPSEWVVPDSLFFKEDWSASSTSGKSIMEPFYMHDKFSDPEKKFINLLNQTTNNVKWWYKNKESTADDFSIIFEDDSGISKNFFPDFIVYFRDNTIGIYETKGGVISMPNDPLPKKSDRLQEYIKEQNQNGKSIKGGIVIFDSHGTPLIYTNDNYSTDLDKWDKLTF